MAHAFNNSILLRDARIIGPDRVIERGSVLVEGARIARIFDGTEDTPAAADSLIDLDGLTLFPGFIELTTLSYTIRSDSLHLGPQTRDRSLMPEARCDLLVTL